MIPLSLQNGVKRKEKWSHKLMASLGVLYTPIMSKHDGERNVNSCTDFCCPKEDCGLEFDKGLDLLRHQMTEDHFREKLCKMCDKRFTRMYDLKRHIMSVHENIKFYCPHCMKSFKRLDTYKTHLKSHRDIFLSDSLGSSLDSMNGNE